MAINTSQIFGVKKTSVSTWTWLPTPAKNGVTITDEPIWASNTGRGSDGTMIGDIVAWKTTVEVAWPVLSFSDAATIVNTITGLGAFFDIRYYDTSASTMVTKTVYCSNIPRVLYSLAETLSGSTVQKDFKRYSGITITFIEQ